MQSTKRWKQLFSRCCNKTPLHIDSSLLPLGRPAGQFVLLLTTKLRMFTLPQLALVAHQAPPHLLASVRGGTVGATMTTTSGKMETLKSLAPTATTWCSSLKMSTLCILHIKVWFRQVQMYSQHKLFYMKLTAINIILFNNFSSDKIDISHCSSWYWVEDVRACRRVPGIQVWCLPAALWGWALWAGLPATPWPRRHPILFVQVSLTFLLHDTAQLMAHCISLCCRVGQRWYVNNEIGATFSYLKADEGSSSQTTPPVKGWQYYNGSKWQADPEMECGNPLFLALWFPWNCPVQPIFHNRWI